MRLKRILHGVSIVSIQNFKNYNISSVSHISQDVISGGMFICIKGDTFNGADYIHDVIRQGCKCIVTQEEFLVSGVCVVVVDDIRKAMSVIAKNFYNNCVDSMRLIGVVGTSGKTSVSHMIKQILSTTVDKIGIVGTNGIFIDNIRMDNKFTTPDPLELHYVFYQMKMFGVSTVIMEVSAQAIHYQKVFGITFDVCVFTNISEEHLDFFGSYETYAKTKLDFFCSNNMKECVVNTDDFFGRELAFKVDVPCVSYGVEEPANVFAIDIHLKLDSTQFIANVMDDVVGVDVPLVGQYSVYNLLAAMSVCKLMGMTIDKIRLALKDIKPIDGRFEIYKNGNNLIIIDFAHTPQSIEKVLEHIKTHSNAGIVSLFGCVGYSDKEKRIAMANAVSRYSVRAYVTTDNIGNACFDDVVSDIIDGLSVPYVVIQDRVLAIKSAMESLKENEILVLLGKGAENFQKIGEERLPYCEKEILLQLLEREDKMKIALISAIVCFVISLLIAPILLKWLRKLKFGQSILVYVEQHKSKSGTPTMGGIIFLISGLIGFSIFKQENNILATICMFAFVFFGLLGFLDDYIKIKFKQNEGLKPYQKVIGQVGISLIIAIFVYNSSLVGDGVILPFTEIEGHIGWLIIPFVMVFYIAVVNSVNLIDGLDGLCGGVTTIMLIMFSVIMAVITNISNGVYFNEVTNIIIVSMSVAGALLGFLCYNVHPAKVFMGDSGSLALGGLISTLFTLTRQYFLIFVVGFVFVLTALSVVLQVASFKLFHKRVFKMSPIHHHFEMATHESKVVSLYCVLTLILGFVAIILYL